jgi:hypothetical protein
MPDAAMLHWAETVGAQGSVGGSVRPQEPAPGSALLPAPGFAPTAIAPSTTPRHAPLQYIGQVAAPAPFITLPLTPAQR